MVAGNWTRIVFFCLFSASRGSREPEPLDAADDQPGKIAAPTAIGALSNGQDARTELAGRRNERDLRRYQADAP